MWKSFELIFETSLVIGRVVSMPARFIFSRSLTVFFRKLSSSFLYRRLYIFRSDVGGRANRCWFDLCVSFSGLSHGHLFFNEVALGSAIEILSAFNLSRIHLFPTGESLDDRYGWAAIIPSKFFV